MNHLLFLGNLGAGEILLIALIVLLLFGGKKIPELMKGLGKGVRSFKEGMNNIEKDINSPEENQGHPRNRGETRTNRKTSNSHQLKHPKNHGKRDVKTELPQDGSGCCARTGRSPQHGIRQEIRVHRPERQTQHSGRRRRRPRCRDLQAMESQNIIGLCDVDWKYADHVFKRYPQPRNTTTTAACTTSCSRRPTP